MLIFKELNIALILFLVAKALSIRPIFTSDEGTDNVIYLKGGSMKRFQYNPWTYSRRMVEGPSPRVQASNYRIFDEETPGMGISSKYENIDLLPRMPGKRAIRQISTKNSPKSRMSTKRPKIGSRTTLVDVTPEFIVYKQFNRKKRLFGRGNITDAITYLA